MYCNPTLTEQEFKVLHNTLWELGNIDNDRVRQLVERIRTVALKGAYAQDNAAFESKHDYYSRFQRDNGLSTIWSVYELPVHGFLAQHPYTQAREICYRDHWGEAAVYETIQGDTWADLYRAADRCVQRSGDAHHVFIENFYPVEGQPHQLRLTTGS
jgi:hypothetical protein